VNALKICPTCGTEYPANERFCPRDGTALRTQGGEGGTDLVGSVIAERYHVIKKLGEGGMGQVYLAEHVKMGRKSAVKVMNPGMVNDADAISRFNREAANASRINHAHVAGIYDFGETPDGLIYLAMEFIEGESLTSIVESNGALPPGRAADITFQTAEALAVAHEMGIVHRDLKPDNIMIAKNRDGSDCVKVVDFGIAKAAGSESQKVTKTGLVVGTPEYMSPEQLAGDKLDGRSDIYSLALVTFHMLTGGLPFPSETAQESMIMRLTERPKALAEIRPETAWTPEVQAVMDRALERDAKLRYQTAGDFGRALLAAMGTMPTAELGTAATLVLGGGNGTVPPTRVAGPGGRPSQPKSRKPILIGAGLVAAAVVAGVIFMTKSGGADKAAGNVVAAAPAPPLPDSIRTVTDSPVSQAVTTQPPVRLSTKLSGASAESSKEKPLPAAATDVGARLPTLLDRSAADATAQDALDEARRLEPRATSTRDRVGLGLVKAQALGILNRDAESCRVLRSIENSSRTTSYEKDVTRLLNNCNP
jgi:eukaryotic-like serine/threonine-protein kinase